MKWVGILLVLVVCFASCDSNRKVIQGDTADLASNDTIVISNDSLEYEIIIIEPGFYSWLVTQRPRGYYGQSYLENRNRLFVTEYNQRVRNWQVWDVLLYPQEINYEFHVDYGYEVNYLLYNYFVYFQERYNQNFINGRGRTVGRQ